MRGAVAAAALAVAIPAGAEDIRNAFGDPFFAVRSAIAGCPEPLGPYVTHEKMLAETHYRSERGTRCYLEGKCARANSYLYDADIAATVKGRFEKSRELGDASLWITVQRRFVWVEGCVRSAADRARIERVVRGVPDVELVIVNVDRLGAKPSYRVPEPGQHRAVNLP